MKRLRDDVFLNPPFKRPFGSSSRGESYGLPNPPIGGGGTGIGGASGGGGGSAAACGSVNSGGGGSGSGTAVTAGGAQKLTTNDALSYLKDVKDMFQDQREKYDRFLDVMKDFKAQRIDTAGVIARVKELFKGHPNLILGFNTFLPKGYEITLTDEEEAPAKRTVEFEEAISFVNKIKKRFQNDDHVYKSFLDILNMYRKEHKGIKEVYEEVATLFEDHPDLLGEFTRFLPDTSSTVSVPQASFGRHSFHRYDERSSAIPTMRQSDKQRMRRDRIIGSHGERDLSVERPDVDDDKTVIRLHKELKKHTDKENRDRKNRDTDERDPDIENNGDATVHRLSEKRKSARKDFMDGKDASKSMYSHEFDFCEKVKERLRSADDYQAFLKCLHIYSTEIITRKELQCLVADLLGKFPDLLEGFNEFLEHCERLEGFLAGVMGKKSLWDEGNSSKPLKIEEKDKEPKREVEVEKEKEKDMHNLKYWEKSIQELDLSDCERCSPSYRLLPEDYPMPKVSARSKLGDQVLNDHWVSVTSGSEDYSFKHMRRNPYEESLFRCEDDRFELDMLLESVSSTAKKAEELLNRINNKKEKEKDDSNSHMKIEAHFSALNLRCIERLYSDHGLDVMDILRKNPSLALTVILTRLKQKQEEWTKCRTDFNKIWADIYSKNHYKSLDQRSFYFKQQDSKNLSTKALVSDIKEIKEKRQKEDSVLFSIAAGNRYSKIPDLEFKYSDAEIHEDIYKIIEYSCEEVCSTQEQINKVLKLWTTFLEPMLGIHSSRHGSVATEDAAASKHPVMKNGIISIEGGDSSCADPTMSSLKLPKPDCNGDSSTSPKHNSSRVSLSNMDSLAKEGLAAPSGERLTDSALAVSSGPDANNGHGANLLRLNNGHSEENSGGKTITGSLHSLEVGGTMRLNQLKNGEFAEGSGPTGHKNDTFGTCKNEKEEGELSPNGDFDDNYGDYQDGTPPSLPMKNRGTDGMQRETGSHEDNCADAAGENDVDADDENSENVSEAGEDVSGSESAADDCSHEEEEDGEHDLDGKAESEGEAENTSEAHDTGTDGASGLQSESFLMPCKPLSKHVASTLIGEGKKDRRFFYGNDTYYVLFRLHQTLYERVLSAKVNSVSGESKWRTSKDESSDSYSRFMSSLFSLLDGSSDNTKFEDDCRSLIGNQSYVLFTLDKLIYKLVKQLQTVSSEEVDCKLIQLYEYENSRKPEKYVDSVYYENVHVLLHDENIFRFQCTTSPTCLSIQLMDDGNEKSEAIAVSVDPNFLSYLHHDYLSVAHGKKLSSSVMLKRNLQKYANLDESTALCMATENVLIMNGLECKMAASSLKISYVLDTEDSFIRLRRRRENKPAGSQSNQAKAQRFHRFLAAFL